MKKVMKFLDDGCVQFSDGTTEQVITLQSPHEGYPVYSDADMRDEPEGIFIVDNKKGKQPI